MNSNVSIILLYIFETFLGLSESKGVRKYRGPAKAIIKEKFGLTMKQLEKKCLAKNTAYWIDVLDALQLNVDMGESLVCDIVEKVSNIIHPTQHDIDELTQDLCETNTVIVNVKEFVTSRIVKCLNEDEYPSESQSPRILRKAISRTCGEVNML